ncbi:hypothetical protein EV190_10190 [Actinorugispora endophytica]|uniref:Uncharacterized protein n=1 Tax=Actinorugispora endophytica TaxID=1605990 RepID=A0A4R6V3I6_9ACTN|nr:hypothetical protein EV190_10190 [Actinorugispora endophytica]
MDLVGQLVTIAAVLLGAVTTYITNHLMERNKHKLGLRTRWDEKKLDAYADYVGKIRSSGYAAVLLYEVREGMRTLPRTEQDLAEGLTDAVGDQSLAFERVMLLAGDAVIDAAHGVQEAMAAITWQARGTTEGTLEEWRALHTKLFTAINRFHERARADLGVSGAFLGDQHSARGLLLPENRGKDGSITS